MIVRFKSDVLTNSPYILKLYGSLFKPFNE
jgi:hypothetical protein